MTTARLPEDLLQACEQSGWDNVYGLWLSRVDVRPTSPNASGEARCPSPFPFSGDDKRASFSINFRNGLWRDFKPTSIQVHGMQGGNIVQFVALMNARNEDGRWQWDNAEAERSLRLELGLAAIPDAGWLATCLTLIGDKRASDIWTSRKPWDTEILLSLGIGFDRQSGRLIFPIREASGRVVATRQYNPGYDSKMVWGRTGATGNMLFPHIGWRENNLILVEGEPDVVTLRRLGFNAVSGTMGAGNPVPPGGWWVGRQIWVCMDDDPSGREAELHAVQSLRGAAEIRVMSLPHWEGKPHNADISDYVKVILDSGGSLDDARDAISALMQNASNVDNSNRIIVEPIDARIAEGLNAANIDVPLRVQANVLSRLSTTYAVPRRARLLCPGGGHQYCARCFMRERNGAENVTFDVERPNVTLKLVKVTDRELRENCMKQLGIPNNCPDFNVEPSEYVSVDVAQVTETLQQYDDEEDAGRYDMYVLRRGDTKMVQGAEYSIVTIPAPLPKTQGIVYFAKSFERIDTNHNSFRDTDENMTLLEDTFKVERTFDAVMHHLRTYADDFANAVTNIYGRPELHIVYLMTWFSQLSFVMRGVEFSRGWIEVMIVGDTACGKTQSFMRMRRWLNSGSYVDCKQATAAGLLGSVETSSVTGERFVLPGVFPRNDGLGPLMLDEFVTDRMNRRTLMSLISSARSEGRVTIAKAAHASLPARVRLLLAANPGDGKLMQNVAKSGVEMFIKSIEQPEDRRRFDMAMAVTQKDVEQSIITELHQAAEPVFSRAASQTLMNWGRSRGPGRILFTESAYTAVTSAVNFMIEKYDSEAGIVEPSSQTSRVAKTAVAIATLCFSHTGDGDLLVDECHVTAARFIMMSLFDNPSFGYDDYSRRIMGNRVIVDERAVREAIANTIPTAGHAGWVNRMRNAQVFRRGAFNVMTPGNYISVQALLQCLVVNNCLEPSLFSDEYKSTPQFNHLLAKLTTELNEGGEICSRNSSNGSNSASSENSHVNSGFTSRHR